MENSNQYFGKFQRECRKIIRILVKIADVTAANFAKVW